MFEIIPYQIQHFELWNQFLLKAKNANFLFHRSFMEYHSDRFKDNSLLIFKNKKLIALLPANRIKNKIYSHQGLTYGGFILDKKVTYFDVSRIFETLLNSFRKEGINELIYIQNPDYQSISSCQEIESVLITLGAKLANSQIASVIEFQSDFETLKQKTRIKNHFDKGFQVKKEADFTNFWNILIQNLKNKHQLKPVHSLQEIQNLAEKFKNEIQLYTVIKDGEILGGTVLFINHYSAVVHVQYVASTLEGRKLRVLDLLFSFLIKKYQRQNTSFGKYFKHFGFGISTHRETNTINKGLLEWKEKFGARTFVHRSYKIEIES
jgi:hypothetical protein